MKISPKKIVKSDDSYLDLWVMSKFIRAFPSSDEVHARIFRLFLKFKLFRIVSLAAPSCVIILHKMFIFMYVNDSSSCSEDYSCYSSFFIQNFFDIFQKVSLFITIQLCLFTITLITLDFSGIQPDIQPDKRGKVIYIIPFSHFPLNNEIYHFDASAAVISCRSMLVVY
jgi:hypothetical protein